MRIALITTLLLSGCGQDPILKAMEDPAWCPTTTEELETVRAWQKEASCRWVARCSSTMTVESCMEYEPPVVATACRVDGCALRRCYEDWDPETAECGLTQPDACGEVYVQQCD